MATVNGITAEKAQEIEDASVVSGAIVAGSLILTTGDGTQINAGPVVDAVHQADTSTHGISSKLVGETEAASLSNKTLINPIIASFLNAQHNHLNAAGGGGITEVDLEHLYVGGGTWTDRTLSSGSAGPKILSSITLNEGIWIVAATHRGWQTNGSQTRVRVGLSTPNGQLSATGAKDLESSSSGNSGGSTSIGLFGSSGGGIIECYMEWIGGIGNVTQTGVLGSWIAVRVGKNASF